MTTPGCAELPPECGEETSLRYRRLRAPEEDGQSLVQPPFECAAPLLEQNERILAASGCRILGRPLAELARAAREETLTAAHKYTTSYRSAGNRSRALESRAQSPLADSEIAETFAASRVIAAGHQPELFHPGVWFKNFALADLARRHAAVALNLVIDTDDAKSANIAVPGGSIESPEVRRIALDQAAHIVTPYEQRPIQDIDAFQSFGSRVMSHLRPFVERPLLRELWPKAVERAAATGNLGAAVAQARHQLEEEMGLVTLELQQSHVCETDSFRWFAGELLCEAGRFAQDHNNALAAYRRMNRVRSQAHPVPDLQQRDDWTETPFWIWTDDDPKRRSLFARTNRGLIEVTDWGDLRAELPACSADGHRIVDALRELSNRGFKLRTKALATTMWARLALSDLFLHGIGGAKYDQLNDEIIRRFFGDKAPGFLTVSATLRLPLPDAAQGDNDENSLAALRGELRELEYQPERHLHETDLANPEIRALVDQKNQLKRHQVPRGPAARSRFRAMAQINEQLRPLVRQKRDRLIQFEADVRRSVRDNAALRSREFAFCLFPRDRIWNFLLEIRPGES